MDTIALAVNGTLMRGLELNGNLTAVGASFERETLTEPVYRLWSINDIHPAMIRVAAGGVAIAVEIWAVPIAGLAKILQQEPQGLCIGKVGLIDGQEALGVLGESILCEGQLEITQYGGWRAYKQSQANFPTTFEQAIAYTAQILEQSDLTSDELSQAIAKLIGTEYGARGFFVTYLTGDWAIADQPFVIQALRTVPTPASELLVKNLAMSTAMAITHRRQGHEQQALGSERVRDRAAKLIALVDHPEIARIAALMLTSAQVGTGVYGDFLQKWGYDQEQKAAIASIFLALSID